MSALRMLPRARPMHLDPCVAMGLRYASGDQTRLMSGDREVVGYGINGRSIYFDSQDCPFPAIRYREVTPEVCALREKELGDWKKLSLCEKKVLYRHSFCQTYAEFQKFSPDWKLVLGVGLWALAIGCALSVMSKLNMYNDPPDTYDEEHRAAQLRRIIQLQINPILGLSSKWCYERNQWK